MCIDRRFVFSLVLIWHSLLCYISWFNIFLRSSPNWTPVFWSFCFLFSNFFRHQILWNSWTKGLRRSSASIRSVSWIHSIIFALNFSSLLWSRLFKSSLEFSSKTDCYWFLSVWELVVLHFLRWIKYTVFYLALQPWNIQLSNISFAKII